jgi:hypothetical protein
LTCADIDGDGVFADVDPDDNDACVPDNTIGLCDTDNDGTPDGLDCAPNDPTAQMIDSCGVCGGEGLSCSDLDGDGVFADIDPDDNDPCVPDNTIGLCDTDNDGTPDGLDCAPNDATAQVLDSCGVCGGEGLSCSDIDGDGVFADVDPDDNDACVPDNTNGLCDTDNDGTPDGLDCAPLDATAQVLDSCGVCGGEGLSCSDADGDGIFADVDPDDNDPCNPDDTVGACDSDNEETPDGLDCAPNDPTKAILDACNVCGGDGSTCTDNDNDGFAADIDPDDNDPCNPDNTVGSCDSDNDGTPDGLDCAPTDATAQVIDSCGICGGEGLSCSDLDGDGVFADVDPDDNNPCVPDNTIGLCDSDNDGTPDGLDCAPLDATAQVIDSCGVCGGEGLSCVDIDEDGVFADIDPDDNDPCIPDNTFGGCDTDGDGVPDGLDQCPGIDDALIGQSCDDGDPLTINDVYTSNCICEGIPEVNIMFALIDADADTIIRIIEDGDTIVLDIDGFNLNIQALPSVSVESIQFGFDGNTNFRIENFPPYALHSDSNGNFASWTPIVGSYNLIASAFDGNDASGNLVTSNEIDFVVLRDQDADGVLSDLDPDDQNPCVPDNTNNLCDTDGDGIPDGLDPCPTDPSPDSDGDGVCDSEDQCPGSDDTIDNNGDGIPDGCADCPVFDFNATPLISYTQQDNGTVDYDANGLSFFLENNSWKALQIDYTVTENTIVQFEFKSTEEGELHEIGFDNNLSLNANPRFKLYGFQPSNGVNTDFDYTENGNWQSFSIPLGDYYSGFRRYILFAADNDANPSIGNSSFRNIKIFEDEDGDGACDLICVSLDCVDEDGDGVFADVDPDDNDACIPNATSGDCCSLIVMNDQSLGTGSFLKAIECATSGDTIIFHPDVYGAIINLNDQFALIDKHLYIKADITNNITINGTALGQAFEILNGFDVVIEGLNIVSGTNATGRAINNNGNLVLKDCNIYDALGTNAGNAILNKGSLLIKGEVNLINN